MTATRPANAAQLALWAEAQADPSTSSSGYFAVTLRGAVAEPDLRAAAVAVLRRHEPLRSVLRLVGDRLHQVVLAADEALAFATADVPCADGAEDAAVRAWMAAGEGRRSWDLAAEPPIRFHLLRHGADRATVVFAVHHVGFDGRSKFVVAADFTGYLGAIRDGARVRPEALPQPDVPEAGPDIVAEAVDHWRALLADRAGPLELPADAATGRRGVTTTGTVELDPADVAALRGLARDRGVSTFTTLVAALTGQLRRYGNEAPILGIAADVSDARTRAVAGLQINVVPMAVEASPDKDPVGEARAALARLARYRRVPFAALVAELGDRAAGRLMTQFGISFPRPPAGLRLEVEGLAARWEFFTPNTSATFAQTLQLRADWPRCRVRLDYRQEETGPAAADRFLDDFRAAVAALTRPDAAGLGPAAARAVGTGSAASGEPYRRAGRLAGRVEPARDPRDPPVLVPAPGAVITAHGPDGEPLPAAVPGRLRAVLAGGETVDTGDRGYVAGDGRARLLGPAGRRWLLHHGVIDVPLVERVARAHPRVAGARIEVREGRRRAAVLTVRPRGGAPAPTVRAVRAHLHAWLPGHDLPGVIEIAETAEPEED
ncbi:condensation domain-containing protein [Actinomadura atramentaria]|uniref:condensation domain-containing protein n=1 Tax=Actinomadura atramentaria TaxID=1990 RepID=UPI0003A4EBDD|nr:condensation domain-containing protein [Actinomadura atramentaria]